MRSFFIFVLCFMCGQAFGASVRSYIKKSGKQVESYERAAPDKVRENNLGFKYGRSRR